MHIPGCWPAKVGRTRSLADSEMKKANGTIHSPQKKNASTYMCKKIFSYSDCQIPADIIIPLERNTKQWQSIGRPGNGQQGEALEKKNSFGYKNNAKAAVDM